MGIQSRDVGMLRMLEFSKAPKVYFGNAEPSNMLLNLPVSTFLILVLLSSPSFAGVTKLPPEAREVLIASVTSAKMLRSTRDIPAEVIQACASVAPEREFRLANPGEAFQATDFILDSTLPRRRLQWAARIPGYYLLHYESGGRARSYHVLLVVYDDSRNARVVWSAAAIPMKDYNEFLGALKTEKLDDTRDYYH
jgi:hypothetical protein